MLKIELVPDLSHCIETVAKREFQDIVQRLLSTEEVSGKLKEKAEILRLFLRVTDFRKLRAQSETHLQRGERIRFIVYLEDGIVKYDIYTQMKPRVSEKF